MSDLSQHIRELAPWWKEMGGALAGLTTFSVGLWRRVVRPRYVKPAQAWFTRDNAVKSIVEREFTANGGSSVIDRLGRMNEILIRTDARVSGLSDHMEKPIFEANASGENTRVNRALELLFGYSSEELLGMGWVQLIHEGDRERVMREWTYAIKDKRAYRMKARYVTSAGAVVPVIVSASPHLDGPAARLIGWLGSLEVQQVPAVQG